MGRQIYSLLLLTAQPPVLNLRRGSDRPERIRPFVLGPRAGSAERKQIATAHGATTHKGSILFDSELVAPDPPLRPDPAKLELAKGFEPPTL